MPDETPTVAPAPAARLRWLASWLESGDCGHAGDADIAPLRALADALEAISRADVELAEHARDTYAGSALKYPEAAAHFGNLERDAERLAAKLAALLPPEG